MTKRITKSDGESRAAAMVPSSFATKQANPNKTTKSDTVLKLLRSKRGASIDEMQKATGWQAHSVRGFLSGTVKKRLGLTLDSNPDKHGVRRYRVVEDKAATAAVG